MKSLKFTLLTLLEFMSMYLCYYHCFVGSIFILPLRNENMSILQDMCSLSVEPACLRYKLRIRILHVKTRKEMMVNNSVFFHGFHAMKNLTQSPAMIFNHITNWAWPVKQVSNHKNWRDLLLFTGRLRTACRNELASCWLWQESINEASYHVKWTWSEACSSDKHKHISPALPCQKYLWSSRVLQ